MVLYITRKHPPSVGGMQRQSQGLVESLGDLVPMHVISLTRSQIWLPIFLASSFIVSAVRLACRKDDLVFLGDLALAPLGCLLKRLFKVSVISYAYGLDITWPNGLYQRFVTPLFRELDHIVCISAYTKSLLCSYGVCQRNCSVVPPGIWPYGESADIGVQEERQVRMRWGLREDAKLILFVGRLIPRKGCAHLVNEVLPRLLTHRADWHCLIVGDGSELQEVRRSVHRCGLGSKVTVLGRVSDEDLRALYLMSQVLVMPNVAIPGDVEGFGIVALEARSAGLPVVAYDVDGVSDSFVHPDDGRLVHPGDPDAFAEAVSAMLDEKLTTATKEARRARVQSIFGWPTIATKLLTVIGPLVSDVSTRR